MKLEKPKELQNVFKSILNEISRGRYKSEEQKKHWKILISREAVINLLNDYPSIASEAKYKTINEKGLKILTSKQMRQRLPIAFAQVKVSNTS